MRMYDSSNHYKDACDVGRVEYASSYRTLVMYCKLKEYKNALRTTDYLRNVKGFVIVGAGDLCSFFIEDLLFNGFCVDAIIEDKKDKYYLKYPNTAIYRFVEFPFSKYSDDLFVITHMDKYNRWADMINAQGIAFTHIVTIEEVIAGILTEVMK